MSDLKNNLKNVPYIKQFFGEYLDLQGIRTMKPDCRKYS